MGQITDQVSVDSLEEGIVARVAAVDVGKDAGVVCTRAPHPEQLGKRVSRVCGPSRRAPARSWSWPTGWPPRVLSG